MSVTITVNNRYNLRCTKNNGYNLRYAKNMKIHISVAVRGCLDDGIQEEFLRVPTA